MALFRKSTNVRSLLEKVYVIIRKVLLRKKAISGKQTLVVCLFAKRDITILAKKTYVVV